MEQVITYLHRIKDFWKIGKVLHFIPEIILLVLLGMMARYLSTAEGQSLQHLFSGDPSEEQRGKMHFSIDGKTVRGNRTADQSPLHIVTAHNGDAGFSVGQTAVDAKSNEITAIPLLIESLSCKDAVITIDASGTQKAIASLIVKSEADYVLALKKNHGNFYSEVETYFNKSGTRLALMKQEASYKKTIDVGHGREEIREYFLLNDIGFCSQALKWEGIQGVGMVKSTVITKDKKTVSYRYYMTTLSKDIELFSRVIRHHWKIESMHWHLDVTFREDASKVINKNLAENLNVLRKMSLSLLKLMEFSKKLSIAKKRYALSMDFDVHVEKIQAL